MDTNHNDSEGRGPSYAPPSADEILRFQQERAITVLFKRFLILLESIEDDHDAALNLLHDKLPVDLKVYVELADYLTEAKAARWRKTVLDAGNDTKRELAELLKSFDIKLRT